MVIYLHLFYTLSSETYPDRVCIMINADLALVRVPNLARSGKSGFRTGPDQPMLADSIREVFLQDSNYGRK